LTRRKSKYKDIGPVTALGLVITIVGLLLPFLGVNVWSVAVVVYDPNPPQLANPQPPGSSDSPTPLTPGDSEKISVVVYEAETDIKSVTCTIYRDGSYIASLTLVKGMSTMLGTEYYKSWTVPSTEGTYKFVFRATDMADNTAAISSYGVVGGQPDGVFYINDEEATETSEIYVKTSTVTIKFVATKNGEYITDVLVRVYDENEKLLEEITLTEAEEDTEWRGSYTFPSPGVYIFKGWFKSGGTWFNKMSIVVGWDVGGFKFEIPSWSRLLNAVTILGLMMLGTGLVVDKRLRVRRR